MNLSQKILVPVDVKADSKVQLATAIELARAFHSEIILMYVVPDESLNEDVKRIVMNSISGILSEINDSFIREGIFVKEPIIEFGKPAKKILEVASREEVDLILPGSGQPGSNGKCMMGTIAGQIVRVADAPVMVIKPDAEAKITSILCPVDFSDPARRALKNAISLARALGSKLRVLAVFEPVTDVSSWIKVDLEKDNAARRMDFNEEFEQFLSKFDLQGINYEIDLQTGIVHEVIIKTAVRHGHDLLVMGTNGRSGLSRFVLGSITEKVICELPCTMLTTKC